MTVNSVGNNIAGVVQSPIVGEPTDTSVSGAGFGDVLKQMSESLKSGEVAALKGVSGEMPLQDVVQQVLSAERTLNVVLSVRDKAVSAYLEMTRMQI